MARRAHHLALALGELYRLMRRGFAATLFLLAGCATGRVDTSEQATAIALASPCSKLTVDLDPGETMPTVWRAAKRGDKWVVWLPTGPGAKFDSEYGHMGAWIDAKTGRVLYCERGKTRAPDPIVIK